MSVFAKIASACLFVFALGITGCDAGSDGPAVAPAGNDLEQFLAENPDIANAEYAEDADMEE